MTGVLSALLRRAAADLRAAGVADPAADARLLMSAAAGLRREDMLREPERPVPADAAARFAAMVGRRAKREPVSRILGRREFRSLTFALGPETLDPRPDSEILVETAIDLVGGRTGPLRILDLGTGSGCLLLSLLHELPSATGVGADISPAACMVARRNAAALGLAGRAGFVACDWADALDARFDLVVSNPPYVSAAEFPALAPEVAQYDPRRALDGGADGLDAYRALAARTGRLLARDAGVAVEIGSTQADAVKEIFRNSGYVLSKSRKDLAGRPRCLAFLQT